MTKKFSEEMRQLSLRKRKKSIPKIATNTTLMNLPNSVPMQASRLSNVFQMRRIGLHCICCAHVERSRWADLNGECPRVEIEVVFGVMFQYTLKLCGIFNPYCIVRHPRDMGAGPGDPKNAGSVQGEGGKEP